MSTTAPYLKAPFDVRRAIAKGLFPSVGKNYWLILFNDMLLKEFMMY